MATGSWARTRRAVGLASFTSQRSRHAPMSVAIRVTIRRALLEFRRVRMCFNAKQAMRFDRQPDGVSSTTW
jgi:hypothetical protein